MCILYFYILSEYTYYHLQSLMRTKPTETRNKYKMKKKKHRKELNHLITTYEILRVFFFLFHLLWNKKDTFSGIIITAIQQQPAFSIFKCISRSKPENVTFLIVIDDMWDKWMASGTKFRAQTNNDNTKWKLAILCI